jgi:flavodoxin I
MGYLIIGLTIVGFGATLYWKVKKASGQNSCGCGCGCESECTDCKRKNVKLNKKEESFVKNVVVIYWSGTGNTQAMAEAVGKGATADAVGVKVIAVGAATPEDVFEADAVALGCPAMGVEVLEEAEMEPFVQSLEGGKLQGKPMALFGSYDWGDGQWMREWTNRMKKQEVRLVGKGLIINNTPNAAGLDRCRALGAALTAAI